MNDFKSDFSEKHHVYLVYIYRDEETKDLKKEVIDIYYENDKLKCNCLIEKNMK